MARLNVTIDNGLDDVKLETRKDKKGDSKTKKEGFFSQVAREMKLVTWPTRKNVFKYFLATLVMIILLAVFFIGLSALFDLLYGLVQGWIG